MKKIFFLMAIVATSCNAKSTDNNTNSDDANVAPEMVTDDTVGTAEGQIAPNFTLKAVDGSELTLSSLRGKFVVIDFWGSWCGWCIKGMPEMKKYYEKYAGKLEILGVDCGDTEDKWKATIEELQLPWKHVRIDENQQDILKEYSVQGFPTKVILNAEGKVAKYVIGEDPVFYTTLDELLKD